MIEKVKLSDYVFPGDNLFWRTDDKNIFMRFVTMMIRWFSKSWSSHVIKARKPDLFYSVTTPKPEDIDDIGVWEHASEVWIRRPVAQFLIDGKSLARMDKLWDWMKKNTDYDEVQLFGMAIVKILKKIGIKIKKPPVQESREDRVCSTYCSFNDCEAFKFDPVPLTPDCLTCPGMLEKAKTYYDIVRLKKAKEKGRWTITKLHKKKI